MRVLADGERFIALSDRARSKLRLSGSLAGNEGRSTGKWGLTGHLNQCVARACLLSKPFYA